MGPGLGYRHVLRDASVLPQKGGVAPSFMGVRVKPCQSQPGERLDACRVL